MPLTPNELTQPQKTIVRRMLDPDVLLQRTGLGRFRLMKMQGAPDLDIPVSGEDQMAIHAAGLVLLHRSPNWGLGYLLNARGKRFAEELWKQGVERAGDPAARQSADPR